MRKKLAGLFLAAALCTAEGALAQTSDSLVIAFGAEPTTMDPARYGAGVDLYGMSQSFEQLLRPDASGKLTNWLAESWHLEGTSDKPIIDVRIRPGVKFHNGDPLTSADFEFSYQRLHNPKLSRWAFYQDSVESFEIVDDLHFRIHFKEPDSNYVANYLQLWAMPKKYIERVGDDEFAAHPIGTGPWIFKSWDRKSEMKFEAFDDYWNKDARPSVKNLTIKLIPEDFTRVAAYKTGAVDFIDAVPLASLDEFRKLPDTSLVTVRTGSNLRLAFPTHIPSSPFNDLRVRLAAAHAIDMDAIIKTVLFGQGQRYAEVAEGGAGYDPSIKLFAYDPKMARQLLAEAGYPRGFDTNCYNLITPREPNVKEYGEAMYAYLTAVGIRCKVIGLEYSAWIQTGLRGSGGDKMDGLYSWIYGHGLPGDPSRAWASELHSYVPGKGWGDSSYINDPEVDHLIEQAKATMDLDQRNQILQHIARLKHERVHSVTTYMPLGTIAWRTSKVTFTPWPTPAYWHQLQQIGLKRGN
jgi:peptide/nickel transport system substrate-binding protein